MQDMLENSRPLRAVGYKRVSMQEQVDGFSLDAQENSIRTYAEKQDWHLVKIYEDAGISAKKGSYRPAFEQLLKDAKNNQFDVVIVNKIDRFYRHLNGLLTSLDYLNEQDVTFASVQEQMDFSTPWGKLILNVLGTLAEIYIDNLRKEVRKGTLQRAKKGLWLGALPYGYCNGLCSTCTNPNGKDYCPNYGQINLGNGKAITAHPVESKVVKLVFKWYSTGEESHRTIAERLNDFQILLENHSSVTARQRGAPGRTEPRPFTRDVIRDMLKRIAYTGKIAYKGTTQEGIHKKREQPIKLFDGKHPPLISETLYFQAREISDLRSTNSFMKNDRPVRIYPLTGVLRCGYCSSNMRGMSNAYYRYYTDSDKVDQLHNCEQESIHANPIEKQILNWLKATFQSTFDSIDDSILAEIDFHERQFQRAKELYLLGELLKDQFIAIQQKTKKAKKDLQANELNAKINFVSETKPDLDRWDELSQFKRKRLLRGLVEAVYVRRNAFVAAQPTLAFQLLTQPQENISRPCSCGEGGIRTRGRV